MTTFTSRMPPAVLRSFLAAVRWLACLHVLALDKSLPLTFSSFFLVTFSLYLTDMPESTCTSSRYVPGLLQLSVNWLDVGYWMEGRGDWLGAALGVTTNQLEPCNSSLVAAHYDSPRVLFWHQIVSTLLNWFSIRGNPCERVDFNWSKHVQIGFSGSYDNF